MYRRTTSTSDGSASRAFARVGWTRLLTSLHRYARVRLRLAAIDAESAGVIEASDLVNTLVERVLEGDLAWALPEHASDEDVVGYACTKLYGMRSTLRRKSAPTISDDALDERPDEAPDALLLLSESRVMAAVRRACEPDPEASIHLGMILEGKERPEIMRELGCSLKHAEMIRKRILRRIAALRLTDNDSSEDEPPSSGPRGRQHDPQATEERQGTPPEPHRSARRAGGRR